MHTWRKRVKTKKEHQCWGCGEVYPSGIEMEYVTNVDGGFYHSYWCDVCCALISKLERWELEDGFLIGDLKQNYIEEWNNVKNKS